MRIVRLANEVKSLEGVTGRKERTCYDLAEGLYCGHQYAALKPRSQVECNAWDGTVSSERAANPRS